MKFTKEQKAIILINVDKNLDEVAFKTNIIGYKEEYSDSFIGVKIMTKKKEAPIYFVEFANEVREFMKMQIEFNKKQMEFNTSQEQFNARQEKFNSEVRKDILEIKQDIIAIKSCPTIKKELDK